MVVIIVQARIGSSRLPGKVLLPILGRPMLSYQIERLRRARSPHQIVVAAPIGERDDAIAECCADLEVECTRGSENDVLSRYCEAARRFHASTVIRITADCPLIDHSLVDRAVVSFFESGQTDYLSNMLEPTWPYGMAVEVVTASALFEAEREASEDVEREHVTPFIYWRPDRYRLKSLKMAPDLSSHRWTVDAPEDFELITRIFEALYSRKVDFNMEDVLSLLKEHPSWSRINMHVSQRSASHLTGKS